MEKVLFARIGYMKKYAGPQPGDLKPIGGGEFNKKNLGNEAFNFKNIDGWHYGYFQPTVKANYAASTVNLRRIDPAAADLDQVDGVTVVFFSTLPGEPQAVVVGRSAGISHFLPSIAFAAFVSQRRFGYCGTLGPIKPDSF